MKNYLNYYIWWKALKEWINNQCLYDYDTITYEDIINKMKELEYDNNDSSSNR